jgi:hypothetical protein
MFRVRDYSIPQKLTWMNMLVSGTALLLASAGFFAYDLYTFRTSTVHNLEIQAQIIGSNSVSALVFDDPHSAENTLSGFQAASHVMFAEIYTPEGRAFAGYRRDHSGSLAPPPENSSGSSTSLPIPESSVTLVRLITFHGKPVGTIYIRSDLQAMTDREKNFALIVVTVFLLSLLAAMWMSSFTRRSIAEPIASRSNCPNCSVGKELFSSGLSDRGVQ